MGSVGKAVAVSGAAVAIGLSSLIVFEADALRSMGIGGVITVVSTLIFALNHSGYAETNALLSDIQRLIQTGERPPDKRVPMLERVKTDAGTYWRYPKLGR